MGWCGLQEELPRLNLGLLEAFCMSTGRWQGQNEVLLLLPRWRRVDEAEISAYVR
jgi:hypothetical protein